MAAIVAMAAIMAVVFCACDPTVQATGSELLEQQYNEISTASKIEQKITITSGAFVQFESEKTYAKTEDGYTVTGKEKRLNDLDVEEFRKLKKGQQDNIKDVFGITGELKAPTDDLVLELNVTGGRVTEVKIEYDSSDGSHVTITLAMTY